MMISALRGLCSQNTSKVIGRSLSSSSKSDKQDSRVRGLLTEAELRKLVESGEIDTVQIVFTDHIGRLMGKRYTGDFFLDSGVDGTHVCNYLMTVDIDTQPRDGFALANWEQGYGDFHLVPDMKTLRRCAWLPKTAMVQCDVYQHDHKTNEERIVAEAPRSILKKQVERADKLFNAEARMASELEYYLFKETPETAQKKGYRDLERYGWFLEDYNMLQSTRSESFHQPARRLLDHSGIPVENTKGEFGHGQHELNVRYSDALTMADNHCVFKQALKEIAESQGLFVSFMAKMGTKDAGSSCHMHLNLVDKSTGKNMFDGDIDEAPGVRCSETFRHFLGGWMHHLPELTPFYAPTINSYKRFVNASWAPTRVAWSVDNRTAGFRIVGSGRSLRIECRIPGADCNPYLGFAAAIASGLDGIENKIEPPPVFHGDIYSATHLPIVPGTLREATERLNDSAFARTAFGDNVVDHYVHYFRLEDRDFHAAVTDWETRRYWELI